MLRTSEGGRYRRESDGTNADQCGANDDRLDFSAASDCFEVLGPLTVIPEDGDGAGVSPATQAECMQGLVDCLVIFNTGQAGANAWAGDNIAGIQSASAGSISFHIAPAARFPFESPRQRFHIVDMPVSFVCDTAAGTLTRYADYAISATQSVAPGGSPALLADNVASCSFSYVQGTGSRNALLTVTVVLRATDTQGAANEVRLVEQISVPNIP
jgi:MSHA biogenesis protein MshO